MPYFNAQCPMPIAQYPIKIKDLKTAAFQLAKSLGLHCTQTKHLKKRGLTKGLDMRRKDAWVSLIARLEQLRFGVVVPHLLAA
jgi:hypothetical protein